MTDRHARGRQLYREHVARMKAEAIPVKALIKERYGLDPTSDRDEVQFYHLTPLCSIQLLIQSKPDKGKFLWAAWVASRTIEAGYADDAADAFAAARQALLDELTPQLAAIEAIQKLKSEG